MEFIKNYFKNIVFSIYTFYLKKRGITYHMTICDSIRTSQAKWEFVKADTGLSLSFIKTVPHKPDLSPIEQELFAAEAAIERGDVLPHQPDTP